MLLTHLSLVVVVPRVWAKELDRPDWSRLAAKPWVFVSPLCSYARFLDCLTREHDIQPKARFHVDEDTTALNLVAAGQALTLTTEEALQGHGFADPNAVCTWPHFSHKMPLSLCYLSARRDDPAITALRETTLALWNESA